MWKLRGLNTTHIEWVGKSIPDMLHISQNYIDQIIYGYIGYHQSS